MTPLDRDRVETLVERVEYVEDCLERLAEKQSLDREEYQSDPEARDVVERRFEKATTACLDVGRMLLKDVDGRAPVSNAAVMKRLHEVDVLSAGVADEMAQAALFRNVLAHEYGDVLDHDIVYEALQDLDRYRLFLTRSGTTCRTWARCERHGEPTSPHLTTATSRGQDTTDPELGRIEDALGYIDRATVAPAPGEHSRPG